MFGKCHEVAPYLASPMGPFDAWPAGGVGFEYFYGFIAGEANQYDPPSTKATAPSIRPKARRRATTSPRILPIRRSAGSTSRRL